MLGKGKFLGWASRVPAWVRLGIAKTLTGLALGLITVTVVVGVSATMFREIQEYGQDLGLRVNVQLERFRSLLGGLPLREKERTAPSVAGYLFLDVDPEHAALSRGDKPRQEHWVPSWRACEALARRLPEEYVLHGASPTSAKPLAKAPTVLDCSPGRPLNRYMLAALLEELRRRGPRLIVLDVILGGEAGGTVVTKEEVAALRAVLGDDSANAPPILFVAGPWQYEDTGNRHAQDYVRFPFAESPSEPDHLHARSAVALPAPGQPVRRYPKCFRVEMSGNMQLPSLVQLPSLPFLAAEIVKPPAQHKPPCPAEGDNQTRIVYTLPPIAGHQDDERASQHRAGWALYHGVYNRCLAARFWDDKRSECGLPAIYKDKVVVIGASSPLRRDRHYTPLGDMAGPEVVINAIRSFVLFPDNRDKSLRELFLGKLTVVGWCAGIWGLYFMLECWCHRKEGRKGSSRWQAVKRQVLLAVAFFAAFTGVCFVALVRPFHPEDPVPSVDILVPVLAVALEIYVEQLSRFVHATEGWLQRLLGVSTSARRL